MSSAKKITLRTSSNEPLDGTAGVAAHCHFCVSLAFPVRFHCTLLRTAMASRAQRIASMTVEEVKIKYDAFPKASKAFGCRSLSAFESLHRQFPQATAITLSVLLHSMDKSWSFSEEFIESKLAEIARKKEKATLLGHALPSGHAVVPTTSISTGVDYDFLPQPTTRLKRPLPDPTSPLQLSPLKRADWKYDLPANLTKTIYIDLSQAPLAGSSMNVDWCFHRTTVLIVLSFPENIALAAKYEERFGDTVSFRSQSCKKDPNWWTQAPERMKGHARRISLASSTTEWAIDVWLPSCINTRAGQPEREDVVVNGETRAYYLFNLETAYVPPASSIPCAISPKFKSL